MNLSIQEQANACYCLRKNLQLELAGLLSGAAHSTDLDKVEEAYRRFREVFLEEKRLHAEARGQ